jgi:triphosphoribosyl-dephospho-CoA synthetase
MKELVARIDAAACEALQQEVDLNYKPGAWCAPAVTAAMLT